MISTVRRPKDAWRASMVRELTNCRELFAFVLVFFSAILQFLHGNDNKYRDLFIGLLSFN